MFLQTVSIRVHKLGNNVNISGIYLRRNAVFDHVVNFFSQMELKRISAVIGLTLL
jgi:hypothetical protein